MRKTYKLTLPENKEVESTNVRVENGQMLVDVELKEKFEPKDGDFCVNDFGLIFIFMKESIINEKRQGYAYIGEIADKKGLFEAAIYRIENGRFATPKEKANFLARIEKECGKRWNVEKKCLEDIYIPKFGDIVRIDHPDIHDYKRQYVISIFPNKEVPNKSAYDFFDICGIDMNGNLFLETNAYYNYGYVTAASESEKQELFDKLAEVGKRWNPETKTLEPIRWRANRNEYYYAMTPDFTVAKYMEEYSVFDNGRYNAGNYFQTPEEVQPYVEKVKEIFKNSKVE